MTTTKANTQTKNTLDSYIAAFAEREKRWNSEGPAWLTPIRKAALARFTEQGFPTLEDEEWRYTNVAPIAALPFREASTSGSGAENVHLPSAEEALTLTFVDGHYCPDLSRLSEVPAEARVMTLRQALAQVPALLEPHLGRLADAKADPFTALNTAFLDDGVFVYVPRGFVLERPVWINAWTTTAGAGGTFQTRNLIVAESGSEVSVIEHYGAANQELTYFTNAVTEVLLAEEAVVQHYLIEEESLRSYNVSTLQVLQRRGSNLTSHSVLLGGALVRNNVHPVLAGEGCQCLINGLYMGTGRQHLDNHMRVEHAKPHGDSRQFYLGILDDESRGVFTGRIIVRQDAQKTDAKQNNRNLLLSPHAQADSKPQLEIYADDVKCTHGATIGQLDDDAIFYLRARGLNDRAARGLLIAAFAGESLGRMKSQTVKQYLEGAMRRCLPHGEFKEFMA